MGLIKFVEKLKKRKNCTLDGNTIVHVLGTIDACQNMWDFSEVCTLDESFSMAINRFKEVYEGSDSSKYYAIRVCYGIDCIYEIDSYGIHVSEPYENIVIFKNLGLSNVEFKDMNEYLGRIKKRPTK